MLLSQNTTSVQMWMDYLNFLDRIEKTMEWSPNDKDAKMKAILERAMESVGHTRADSGCIWLKYIDFETMRNNVAMINLLCYMAMQTPLRSEDSQKVLAKCEGILNNLFEQIFQQITLAESQDATSLQIPDRYKPQQDELVKLITGQFKGEKDAYLQHLKTIVLVKSE